MSAKQRKLILIVCLLVGIFLCGVGCISLTRSINLKGNPNSLSVESFTIITELNQREEFFSQMRKFADKHALKFALVVHSSDKASFAIQIDGDGFLITAVGTTNTPREIDIGFFNAPNSPTLTRQATVDELMDDIKRFVNEIPNVKITEVRRRLRITMDESQREELFTQMRKLADEHSLELNLSFSSDTTLYLVEIYGDGFHIISDARSNPPGEFVIVFFLDYYKRPTPTSLQTVDELFNELKGLLGEIPNVTITEEK